MDHEIKKKISDLSSNLIRTVDFIQRKGNISLDEYIELKRQAMQLCLMLSPNNPANNSNGVNISSSNNNFPTLSTSTFSNPKPKSNPIILPSLKRPDSSDHRPNSLTFNQFKVTPQLPPLKSQLFELSLPLEGKKDLSPVPSNSDSILII